jgi:hypothetical protein
MIYIVMGRREGINMPWWNLIAFDNEDAAINWIANPINNENWDNLDICEIELHT